MTEWEAARHDAHGRDGAIDPPFDQQPVDQQPLPPRPVADERPLARGPSLPGVPQLPAGIFDGPAMASRPTGAPLIPLLETTSPVDMVGPIPGLGAGPTLGTPPPVAAIADPYAESSKFAPLRTDPPPRLWPTWWLRLTILASIIGALGITMWTEYQGEAGDVASSTVVLGAHVLAGSLLVIWSWLALGNAGRIVPSTLYRKRSSGGLAVALWVLAALSPIGVIAVSQRLDQRLDARNDLAAVAVLVAAVMLALLLVWLPFRYHARQAARVGAPHRVMLTWFFAPLLAAVGGLVAVAVGLGATLSENGLAASERLVQVGVAYGLPMLVFALATSRAVTVFDEVIDLRWRRWRTEWEQTLGTLADLPAPGPEDSPSIDGLIGS